jgi:hypothetical protein
MNLRWCLPLVISTALLIALCPALLTAQYAKVAPPPEYLKAGFDSITDKQAKEWLGVLAGPKFQGRGTGQKGYMKAAHWVAGKLAEFGLEPIGERGTYFQTMPMTRRSPDMDKCEIKGPGGLVIKGTGNFGFERFTDQPELTGAVVFLNINGRRPALPQELSLREKIVIYVTDDSAASIAPNLIARKRPAAAIRVVDTTPKSIDQVIFPDRRRRSTSVSGTISRAAATQIANAVGGSADWLKTPRGGGVIVHDTGKQLAMTVRLIESKAGAPNVVALLEGSDPKLKNEYIVIGAHLDHLGIRGGNVYPGADDNGSGSTAVLSIARAMAENKIKPKRSVLFMWFAAEEMGLIGSRYYCNNPILPLENMTCMFNIDMVGRNEQTANETSRQNEGRIHLIGSRKGETKLHDIILAANQYIGFEFEYDQESVFPRSDQINFYRKGVPVAFLFGGFHPDYHRPSDKIKEINYKKIASAARLYYLAIHKAAEHGKFNLKPEPNSR